MEDGGVDTRNVLIDIYLWTFPFDRFPRGYMLFADTFLIVLGGITILTYDIQYNLWHFLPLVCCIQTN